MKHRRRVSVNPPITALSVGRAFMPDRACKNKKQSKIIIFYHKKALLTIKNYHNKRFASSFFTIKESP